MAATEAAWLMVKPSWTTMRSSSLTEPSRDPEAEQATKEPSTKALTEHSRDPEAEQATKEPSTKPREPRSSRHRPPAVDRRGGMRTTPLPFCLS